MSGIAPDHSGYLDKGGGNFIFFTSKTTTRWFELFGHKLHYYVEKPTTDEEREAVTGTIDLHNTRCVDNPKAKFSWILTGPDLPKDYTLMAASEEEKKVWIEKMENPMQD